MVNDQVMDQSTEAEYENGATTLMTEGNQLIISPKNIQNATDDSRQKLTNPDIIEISISKDDRRSSATLLESEKETIFESIGVKVYKRRWIMLFIFLIYAFLGAFQWAMYSIIANIITKYYKVSNFAVEFTSMTFLITYLITFLPAGWILNNWGLRKSILIGSTLNLLGCFLRVFSVPPDRFWVTQIGQSIVGFSQVFGMMIPTRLAAVWFPAHQVSFACSFAFNGYMVGNAAGFLGPPLLVQNSDNLEDIAKDLNRVYIGLTVLALVSFLLSLTFFQDKPPLPPSQAQRLQRIRKIGPKNVESLGEFLSTVKRLFGKRSFMILLISFSFNIGVFTAICALLNQVLIPHFPGCEKEVGIIGLMFVVPGIVSSAVFGCVLDRTHAFKTTVMSLYLLTLVGWAAFTILLPYKDITWLYISSGIMGFSTGAAWLAGLEFAIEITYPEPEGTVTAVLGAEMQLFGVFYTLLYGYSLEKWGDSIANMIMAVPITTGCIVLAFMQPKLKRQAAQQIRTIKQLDDLPR